MNGDISIISIILFSIEVIISEFERLEMLRYAANKDTMESGMMDGSHRDE